MTPLNWADGRNFDLNQLSFWTADVGFILGEGVLGETPLGPDGSYVSHGKNFTSITANYPGVVEDGLFVHREVASMELTTTDPSLRALKGKRIYVQYGTKKVFDGTVTGASQSEEVDVGRPFLAGNTDVKTYRVALRCTANDEFMATTLAPARVFTFSDDIRERMQSYLSWPGTAIDAKSDPDIDGGIGESIQGGLEILPETTALDERRTLLETFRDLARRLNYAARLYANLSRVETEGTGRPHSGGTTLVSGLRFSDDPSDLTDLPSATYSNKTHTGVNVSYTRAVESEDPSMFCTGVTVQAKISGVDTVMGPYATSGTNRRTDVTVELGTVFNTNGRGARVIRSWVSTLPLKSRAEEFVSQIVAPLQSLHQIQNRIPGLARLTREGVTKSVAVIGVTHRITTQRWIVEYQCAPAHLLTRVGDRDPSVPRILSITQTGAGAAVQVAWSSPLSLPANRTMYKHVMYNAPGVGTWTPPTPFDTEWTRVYTAIVSGEAPGSLQTATIPFASLTVGSGYFWVLYTTYPLAGGGTWDPSELWSYPLLSNFVVT